MRMSHARRLAEATGSWLHFEFCCFRADQFSESSLKAAIGNALSTFDSSGPGARVYAEYYHAALNPMRKSRRVDFVLGMLPRPSGAPRLEFAVETKWAGSSHCSPDRVLTDFLRLALIKKANPEVGCIFVLAGHHSDLKAVLAKPPFKVAGAGSNSIRVSTSSRKFKLNHESTPQQVAFRAAIKAWAPDFERLPAGMTTIAYGPHPEQPLGKTVDFQALAWEITAVDEACTTIFNW